MKPTTRISKRRIVAFAVSFALAATAFSSALTRSLPVLADVTTAKAAYDIALGEFNALKLQFGATDTAFKTAYDAYMTRYNGAQSAELAAFETAKAAFETELAGFNTKLAAYDQKLADYNQKRAAGGEYNTVLAQYTQVKAEFDALAAARGAVEAKLAAATEKMNALNAALPKLAENLTVADANRDNAYKSLEAKYKALGALYDDYFDSITDPSEAYDPIEYAAWKAAHDKYLADKAQYEQDLADYEAQVDHVDSFNAEQEAKYLLAKAEYEEAWAAYNDAVANTSKTVEKEIIFGGSFDKLILQKNSGAWNLYNPTFISKLQGVLETRNQTTHLTKANDAEYIDWDGIVSHGYDVTYDSGLKVCRMTNGLYYDVYNGGLTVDADGCVTITWKGSGLDSGKLTQQIIAIDFSPDWNSEIGVSYIYLLEGRYAEDQPIKIYVGDIVGHGTSQLDQLAVKRLYFQKDLSVMKQELELQYPNPPEGLSVEPTMPERTYLNFPEMPGMENYDIPKIMVELGTIPTITPPVPPTGDDNPPPPPTTETTSPPPPVTETTTPPAPPTTETTTPPAPPTTETTAPPPTETTTPPPETPNTPDVPEIPNVPIIRTFKEVPSHEPWILYADDGLTPLGTWTWDPDLEDWVFEPTPQGGIKVNPKTGDESGPFSPGFIILLAGAAISAGIGLKKSKDE